MPAKKTKENQENPPKGGGKKRLLLVLVLCVVLGGGLGYGALRFFHVLPSGGAGEKAAREARHEHTEKLDLGDKVVNLANGESGRYLRVRVVLEYPAQKKLSEEVKDRQPMITEKVLNIFRSKRAEEILPVKNQEKVKEDILKAINADLQQGKISQVYFTDFLVQ
ncbi:MAG: flagellar basal body-associated FliL family protein [Firmicutes bacterium]|nr:flagellar basal body-associated FliL family protein [Bacillota bacterium]